jgi:hypothetical protein
MQLVKICYNIAESAKGRHCGNRELPESSAGISKNVLSPHLLAEKNFRQDLNMRRLQLISALLTFIVVTANAATIEWNAASRQFVTAGGYARVKKLTNNDLVMVYSAGAVASIRKSSDNGATWGAATQVARMDGYSCTNAECIELHNGWLLFGWNARPVDTGAYAIHTSISRDAGKTWSDSRRVYAAGRDAGTGCWEPAFLQLPSGEVQVYFANEAPYTGANNDQEIGMKHSSDNGLTWTGYTKVSYRAGGRDGMPVPLLLRGDTTIAVAIEDNGLQGLFKPSIVSTTVADDWQSGFASGADPRRWGALSQTSQLPDNVYAGAPYLVQLPSGTTVLSVQSTEGRILGDPNHIFSTMKVYCGDRQARNFTNESAPFSGMPDSGRALWNSLTVIDDSTLLAVSTLTGLGQNGIWTVAGTVHDDSKVAVAPSLWKRESTLNGSSITLMPDNRFVRVVASTAAVFTITDLQGRTLYKIDIPSAGIKLISLNHLSSGLYCAVLSAADVSKTSLLVKN